jgi:hypothetical protein
MLLRSLWCLVFAVMASSRRTSTQDLHQAESDELEAYSAAFEAVRRTRDLKYHGHYTLARQRVQDEIVEGFMGHPSEIDQILKPWIVFTCGCPGAGKSTMVEFMDHAGILPLDRFAIVDPDAIRYQLPEWPAFVAEDPVTAAARTQKEAGYIAELIQEEALRRGRSVLVDGTLRDVAWYTQVLQRVKRAYPEHG